MSLRALFAPLAAVFLASSLMAQEVNVYSYRQPELVQPLFDAFTEKTGISVNSVFLNKGMAERLKAEGKRSPADLAFTVDIGRLSQLKAAGVLQPVHSDILDAAIPPAFRDPDGEWFGLTTRARVIFASRDRVAEGEITTYEDLASEKWRDRICIRSGTNAYNLALIAGMIEQYDMQTAKAWLTGLRDNLARKPQGNDRAQVKAISEGECDISVGNAYYMALMMKNDEQRPWAEAVRIIYPTFEAGGTHVNVSGVGLTRAAPNRDNAILLMEFLASDEGQRLYAEINSETPISPRASATRGGFTADDANLQTLADLRPDALRLVEEVDFDR